MDLTQFDKSHDVIWEVEKVWPRIDFGAILGPSWDAKWSHTREKDMFKKKRLLGCLSSPQIGLVKYSGLVKRIFFKRTPVSSVIY